MHRIDVLAESASRWLASRTTRRSFLGTTGRAAIVVAGGAGLTQVFARRADARLCGQSGVSPKCPTFDCVGTDVAWGWCWYASPGCCSNGGLKKICDCCKTNHPNVQGYCPDGSTVYCVVESCLEDPRVQTVHVERYEGLDAVDVSMARTAQRNAGSAPVVVMANGLDPLTAAVAAPVAGVLGAPLLLADPGGVRPGIREELDRLGATRIVIVGSGLDAIRSLPGVEAIGPATNPGEVSVAVALWMNARSKVQTVLCTGSSTNSVRIAAAAGSYCALRGIPLLVGTGSVKQFRARLPAGFAVVLLGDEVADASLDGIAGPAAIDRVRGVDPSVLTQKLADRFFSSGPGTFPLVVVSDSASPTAVGALPTGGVVVVHGDNAIDPALRDWLRGNRKRFSSADLLQTGRGSVGDQGVYDLQSAVNGYEAQFLIGADGQGLPVIAQPMEEREIGRARVSGKPVAPSTLASRANAKRKAVGPNPAPPVSTPPTPVPRTVPPVPSTTTTTAPTEPSPSDGGSAPATSAATTSVPPTLPIVG